MSKLHYNIITEEFVEVADDFNPSTYEYEMGKEVDCAACGSKHKYGYMHFSTLITNTSGYSYTICHDCKVKEMLKINKSKQLQKVVVEDRRLQAVLLTDIFKFKHPEENKRYCQLVKMYNNDEIRNLKIRPKFSLQNSYFTLDGEYIPCITYEGSFCYEQYAGKDTYGYDKWNSVVEIYDNSETANQYLDWFNKNFDIVIRGEDE